MGAKQSQDSTMSEPPPRSTMPSGLGTGRREDEVPEGDGILAPPIFPSLLTTGSSDPGYSNSNHQMRGRQRGSSGSHHRPLDRSGAPATVPSGAGRSGGREEEEPEGDGILIPPIFPSLLTTGASDSDYSNSNASINRRHRDNGADRHRSLDRSGEAVSLSLTGGSQEERSSHRRHHRHHHRHHHSHTSNSSSSETNHDHTHHHHRRHHHHRERREHGNDRRARRYLAGNGSGGESLTISNPNSLELDLNFSLIALNQRLRALQLRRESEENGTAGSGDSDELLGGAGGESVGRHRSRSHTHSHSHSHSRNQFNPSSLFFMAPSRRRSKCPFCDKDISSADMETHVVMCMTKPAVEYNEDDLIQDAGECSICLEDMLTGDRIARLPCLCVYHLKCLKLWYKKNQTCPEHPEFYGT